MRAVALSLALACAVSVAHAGTPAQGFAVFAIRANAGVKMRWGYGFLVHDWRPGTRDYLLVTAAHVGIGADNIDVFRLPDDHIPPSQPTETRDGLVRARPLPPRVGQLRAGSAALVWPAYELIAFPLDERDPVVAAAQRAELAIARADDHPAPKSEVFIFAFADLRGSAQFPVETLGGKQFISVGEHAKHIAANTNRSEASVLGSMAGALDTPLIAYTIPSMVGMSGAPVSAFVHGVPTIIAVHIAGLDQHGESPTVPTVGTAWAVCLGPATQHPPVVATLGTAESWPDYAAPEFRQGDERYYPDVLREAAIRDPRSRGFVGAAASYTTSLHGTATNDLGLQLSIDQLGYEDTTVAEPGIKVDVVTSYRTGDYAFRDGHHDVWGIGYRAREEICIPPSLCSRNRSLTLILAPLDIGYLHGDAIGSGSTIHAVTLAHGFGVRGDWAVGPLRVFGRASLLWEKAIAIQGKSSDYTHMLDFSLGIELRVADYRPWVK